MTMRLGALHDALLQPGNPELAQLAAEEVANYDRHLAAIRRDLAVLTWLVGLNLVVTVTLIGLRLYLR